MERRVHSKEKENVQLQQQQQQQEEGARAGGESVAVVSKDAVVRDVKVEQGAGQ
jgi:hypothetical protein